MSFEEGFGLMFSGGRKREEESQRVLGFRFKEEGDEDGTIPNQMALVSCSTYGRDFL